MEKNTLYYVAFLLVGVFISAISQVLLKKAAIKHHSSVIREYLNWKVIIAYLLFFCSTLISVYAYRGVPLSMGAVLEATSYIYVTIFGVAIFKENINGRKILALTFIISGIAVFALAG
jgi:multidrug transporter EmrE-like cation transporter